MSIIYGIKIFDLDKIKEMIQEFGLEDFSQGKNQGKLKNPTLNEIIDFVYYECLPLIPFQILEAFSRKDKMKLFKKSFTDHLHLTTRVRMDFEESLNKPRRSLLNYLEVHDSIPQNKRYYKKLDLINDFYSENYYKPTKMKGATKTEAYQISDFQGNLYARTIVTTKNNPLYAKGKEEYHKVLEFHRILNKGLDKESSSLITSFLIESTYNLNFMKQVTKYIMSTKIINAKYLKNLILFGLLPNVNSRNHFIDVLVPYSQTCADKVNPIYIAKHFFQLVESEIPDNLKVNRINEKALRNQFYTDGLLVDDLNNYMTKYKSYKANEKLEEWLHSLTHFIFPIMEMYTYYLIKDIFKVTIHMNLESVVINNNDEPKEDLAVDEIVVFNLVSRIMYKIHSIKLDAHLPITKELVESEKIINSFMNDPLPDGFSKNLIVDNFYKSTIVSQKIIRDAQIKIDLLYMQCLLEDKTIRAFENASSAINS